jgi:[lysine-biosynthesis-protein LysW]--L-2-aminoadipate ligase
MRFAVIAHQPTPTNVALVAAARPDLRAQILSPREAASELADGDVALARIDVAEGLDGIEAGLWELAHLPVAGVRLLNPTEALVAAHDKLATSRILEERRLPHPRTVHVTSPVDPVSINPPVVVKPRFGSWGRDVVLCPDRDALSATLLEVVGRPWFTSHGALVQELIPPPGHDLRIVVAGGMVVGAVRRVAAPGEWRTNVALGATREPTVPPPAACALALAAAAAIEADLVGVDLMPTPDGRHVVIELNGAVEFTKEYSLDGAIFERTLEALFPDPVAAIDDVVV